MSRVCVCTLTLLLVLLWPTDAAERSVGMEAQGDRSGREKRAMPYWNLWASDLYGWVEELRAQAGYDALLDLARTYWAHFPIANSLGYEPSPGEEDEPEQQPKD